MHICVYPIHIYISMTLSLIDIYNIYYLFKILNPNFLNINNDVLFLINNRR